MLDSLEFFAHSWFRFKEVKNEIHMELSKPLLPRILPILSRSNIYVRNVHTLLISAVHIRDDASAYVYRDRLYALLSFALSLFAMLKAFLCAHASELSA